MSAPRKLHTFGFLRAHAVDNTLKRIAVSGGPPQTICTLDGALRGGSWGPDDTIVFATVSSKGLRRVAAAGGEPQVLTKVDPAKGETDHWWPDVLPDGKRVVFTAWSSTADRSRIVAMSLPSGTISDVVHGGTHPQFSRTGHLVYAVDGTLRAVRFSAGTLQTAGNPVPVLEGVAFASTGSANYAVAPDGSLFYVKGSSGSGPVGPQPKSRLDAGRRQGGLHCVAAPAIHPHALEGALVSLAAMWRLPVLHPVDAEHSARILQFLANQASRSHYVVLTGSQSAWLRVGSSWCRAYQASVPHWRIDCWPGSDRSKASSLPKLPR